MAFEKFLLAFDLHGDMGETSVVNAFHRFARDFKPKHRVIGGDVFDMRALRKKASEAERRESLLADFAAGMEFIEHFRPTALIEGNHDKRLRECASAGDGPASDLAFKFASDLDAKAERLGCRVLPFDKRKGVLALGRLRVLHGFYAGDGACKKHAQVYGPCVFGHIHAADHASVASYDGLKEAWSSPALCKLDMDYNSGTPSTLRYSNGWCYGEVSDKSYHVEIAKVIDGRVTVSTGFKTIAA